MKYRKKPVVIEAFKYDIFEATYDIEGDTMNFGQALDAVKEGKQVTRKGWNGKGQFIYLIKGAELQNALKYGYGEYEGEPTLTDVLAIKTTSNHIQVGWLASQSDMLANDWLILPEIK